MLATSSTAYTGSRSLPRSTRERGCALSLSICSRTLPFPSGARVSMKTDPETARDALKRFVASAAAWCEYPASCAPPWEYAVAICPVMRRAVVSVALRDAWAKASPYAEAAAPYKPARTALMRRSEEHTSELQSPCNLVCRLLLEKKKINSKL